MRYQLELFQLHLCLTDNHRVHIQSRYLELLDLVFFKRFQRYDIIIGGDDVSLALEELTDQTDFTAITTVDAVEIADNGTSVFYASDTTITHATIEHDNILSIDFDQTDTPDYVTIAVTGWYNADVN